MLLRESMGISADDSTRAFPSDDVEAFFKRKPVTMKRDLSEFYSSKNTNHFILAVDPSGGGASQFACASIAQQSNGMVVVRRSRPVSQPFPGKHLGKHGAQNNELIGTLCAMLDEPWNDKGQHALVQIDRQWVVEALCDFALLEDRKQQHRPSARDAVGVVWQPRHVAHLGDRLLGRRRVAIHFHQKRRNSSDAFVHISLGTLGRQRRPHERRLEHVPPQLLGVDALRTKDVRSTHALVVKHIAAVRTISGLENSTVVLSLESNLAFECQHIVHAIQAAGVKRWVCLSEGAGGTIGWLTTNERKESMCFMLRDALKVGNIALSAEFKTTNLETKEALRMLEDEMGRFAIIVEPPKTTFGRTRRTYTGKIGGQQDDIVICVQLAIAGLRTFYSSDKYSNFRPEM